MITFLVVDDETAICNALKDMILQRYGEDVKVCQAENGLKAMELICSIPVDLIITDVKMPVMDGLDMIEKLKTVDYQGEVIVVSGFDDYALVRQAMKRGAVDYLLKPIEPAELFSLIDSCMVRLEHSRILQIQTREHMETLEETLYKDQYIITELYHCKPDEGKGVLEGLELKGEVLCIVALLDVFQKNLSVNAQKKAWALEITDSLNISGSHVIQGSIKDLWAVLFFYQDLSQKEHFDIYMEGLIKKQVKACCMSPCSIYEISGCLHECILKIEQLFFDLPQVAFKGLEPFPSRVLMGQLLEAVCGMDFVTACSLLHKLFYQICMDKPPVETVRQHLSGLIYSVMQKNNTYIRIISNYKFTENDLLQVIQNDLSADHLEKEIIRILDIYMSEALSHVSQRDEYYIQKAKEYIGKNYGGEITLSSLAEYLNIHPNYFSSLFKKKTGISYTKFLRQVRIEAACTMIKNSTKKFYEIAELTGYHDTVQFNRAFREETGMAPGAYRRKLDL